MTDIASLPKAELHAHLEGTMTPALARKLAARHGMTLPETLFANDTTYAWKDFLDFLNVYEQASQVIKTPEDWYDVTYDYLARSAAQGVIYSEVMPSPDHAKSAGLDYPDMLDGISRAIEQAKADHGITATIYISCVRNYGAEKCEAVAKLLHTYPHPLVTGFGMGGDEAGFPPALFEKAYAIARDAGVGLTAHAGEWEGPEQIRIAIDKLGISRIGHGVRAIEDENLVQELVDRNITLELCPTSNIVLGVYQDFAHYPLNQLIEAGVKVTLGSDDPPYFATTIGDEYQVANNVFGLNAQELKQLTHNAITAGFISESEKQHLLGKLGS